MGPDMDTAHEDKRKNVLVEVSETSMKSFDPKKEEKQSPFCSFGSQTSEERQLESEFYPCKPFCIFCLFGRKPLAGTVGQKLKCAQMSTISPEARWQPLKAQVANTVFWLMNQHRLVLLLFALPALWISMLLLQTKNHPCPVYPQQQLHVARTRGTAGCNVQEPAARGTSAPHSIFSLISCEGSAQGL